MIQVQFPISTTHEPTYPWGANHSRIIHEMKLAKLHFGWKGLGMHLQFCNSRTQWSTFKRQIGLALNLHFPKFRMALVFNTGLRKYWQTFVDCLYTVVRPNLSLVRQYAQWQKQSTRIRTTSQRWYYVTMFKTTVSSQDKNSSTNKQYTITSIKWKEKLH